MTSVAWIYIHSQHLFVEQIFSVIITVVFGSMYQLRIFRAIPFCKITQAKD